MLSGDLWDKLWSQQQKDAGDVNLQSLPEPTPVRKTKAAKNAIIYSDIYIYTYQTTPFMWSFMRSSHKADLGITSQESKNSESAHCT